MIELRPYSGNHAGDLHYLIVDGQVERNATPLEVELWKERNALAAQNGALQEGLKKVTIASCKTTAAVIADRVLSSSPVACLAEVRAQAVEGFCDQWNMELGGDNEFVKFAYSYAERIRQESQP